MTISNYPRIALRLRVTAQREASVRVTGTLSAPLLYSAPYLGQLTCQQAPSPLNV